jgi:hypothetical protein
MTPDSTAMDTAMITIWRGEREEDLVLLFFFLVEDVPLLSEDLLVALAEDLFLPFIIISYNYYT